MVTCKNSITCFYSIYVLLPCFFCVLHFCFWLWIFLKTKHGSKCMQKFSPNSIGADLDFFRGGLNFFYRAKIGYSRPQADFLKILKRNIKANIISKGSTWSFGKKFCYFSAQNTFFLTFRHVFGHFGKIPGGAPPPLKLSRGCSSPVAPPKSAPMLLTFKL